MRIRIPLTRGSLRPLGVWLLLAAAAAVFGEGRAFGADTFYWYADGVDQGGSGTWSSTSQTWVNEDDYLEQWFDNPTHAVFGGTAGTVTLNYNITVGAGIEFDTSGYVLNGSGSIQLLGGSIVTYADATVSCVLTGSSSNLSVGGSFNSTLTLGAANTYGGSTTIIGDDAGGFTLKLTTGAAIPSGSAVTLQHDPLLNLNNQSTTIGSLASDSYGGSVALGTATLTMGGNNSSTTFSGIISGTGAINKTGTGTLTLSGANTYSAGTAISGGAIAVTADGNLGATAGTVDFNGGTLRSDASFSLSSSRPFDLADDGYIDTNGNTLTIPGTISGNGNLIKEGSGTLSISGTKTGTGEIFVSGGTMQISSTFTTGSSSFASAIGYGGAGILTQTGATSTYNSGSLIVGYDATGTYNLENGSALVAANDLYVGDTGQGTFNQSGTSSATIYGTLYVDPGLTGSAYNLSAGTLTTGYTDNYGTITQTGGTHYAVGTAAYSLTNEVGATYTLSGGTLGTYGTLNGGLFTQSNGSTHIIVGTFYNYAGAHYALSGTSSTLDVDDSDSDASAVNNGTFTQTGGTAYMMNLSGTGSFALSGGTLSLSGSSNSLDSLSFTFGGGTLATTVNISTSASITLNSGGGTFDIASGTSLTLSHSISGTGGLAETGAGTLTLSPTTANTYTGGTTISSGATLVISTAGALPDNGAVANNGTFEINASETNTAGAITGTGDMTVAVSDSLTAASIMQGTLTVDGTAVIAATTVNSGNTNATTSVLGSLSIPGGSTPTGTLNLNNNRMIITNGGAAARDAVTADITNARNGGLWNQPGITSSNAQAAYATNHFDAETLGVVLNSDLPTPYTSFEGDAVGSNDVLVKFTYGGDADLDGTINGNDYFQIDRGFLNHYTGWVNGDFNYDGVINGNDYFIIDSNFIDQSGPLARTKVLMHAAWFGPAYLSEFTSTELAAIGESDAAATAFAPAQLAAIEVPEPASLAVLSLGAIGFLIRRRR